VSLRFGKGIIDEFHVFLANFLVTNTIFLVLYIQHDSLICHNITWMTFKYTIQHDSLMSFQMCNLVINKLLQQFTNFNLKVETPH